MFCRLAAQEISLLSPVLSQANVRLIGIGLEPGGVEEFVERKFWAGELYINENSKAFEDLGFKRFSLFSLPRLMLAKVARDALSKGKERGLGGNMKGDGLQNGGLIIVQEGKIIYSFIQENPADHASNEDILKALNIAADVSTTVAKTSVPNTPSVSCDGDVCTLKPKSTN